MATIEQFEDHCWNDVVPAADMKLYSCYARATYVGPRPALLAIDLYNIVYRGGPHSPYELDPVYPNSCGIYAHRAIEPTKRLFAAARAAAIPIFYCTQETRPNNRPAGAVSTRRQSLSLPRDNDDYDIYREFTPQDIRHRHPQAACQCFPGHAAGLAPDHAGREQSHRLRREHVGMRAGELRRRLFQRLPCLPGGGMHVRPRRAHPQGQPVRSAPQIHRCHACRRGHRASRSHGRP